MAINYSRVNWDTTKSLGPTNLNNMDLGIKKACDGVDIKVPELSFLGWNVPDEYTGPKNYVDADGKFHQRVGRVNLGSLSWAYNSSLEAFRARGQLLDGAYRSGATCYCSKYTTVYTSTDIRRNSTVTINSIDIFGDGTCDVAIHDSTHGTDTTSFKNSLANTFLYYELATENVISVGGESTSTSYLGIKELYGTLDGISTNSNFIGNGGTNDLNDAPQGFRKYLTPSNAPSWCVEWVLCATFYYDESHAYGWQQVQGMANDNFSIRHKRSGTWSAWRNL